MLGIEVLGGRSVGQARILEDLISGAGFIGGGAILKAGATTHALAAAASVPHAAAIGYGFWSVGPVSALTDFLVLAALPGSSRAAVPDPPRRSDGPIPWSAACPIASDKPRPEVRREHGAC